MGDRRLCDGRDLIDDVLLGIAEPNDSLSASKQSAENEARPSDGGCRCTLCIIEEWFGKIGLSRKD